MFGGTQDVGMEVDICMQGEQALCNGVDSEVAVVELHKLAKGWEDEKLGSMKAG